MNWCLKFDWLQVPVPVKENNKQIILVNLDKKELLKYFFFKLNFKLPVPLSLLEVSWSQHAWLDLHSESVALDFSAEEVHHQFLLPDWK